MIILTMEELATYCSPIGITQQILNQANSIVNSQIGDIFNKEIVDEPVKISQKKLTGKLSKISQVSPLIQINAVKAVTRSPFGMSTENIDIGSIYVNEYGYLEYFGYGGMCQTIFTANPYELLVSYTCGLQDVPEELKMACAGIAQAIAKRGMSGLKSLTDYDVQLAWTDDSIITYDIRQILLKYRVM